MKKTFTRIASASFVALLCCWIGNLNAQIINEDANWPNEEWTLTGDYVVEDAGGLPVLTSDPTVDGNFAYDDDEAGSGSNNQIAAESPVIDLTAAVSGGENFLELSGEYIYTNIGADFINIEYWDADAGSWQVWHTFQEDTEDAPLSNFCEGDPDSYLLPALDIGSWSANQLSNFQYRINFDDADVWAWGFCFEPPLLTSVSEPTVEGCTDPTAANYDADANTDDGSCFYTACADAPISGSYCYGENEDQVFAVYAATTPGDGVTIEFEEGMLAGLDDLTIYDGPGTDSPVLATVEGAADLEGMVFESTGDTISLHMNSSTVTSCQSGATTAAEFVYNVYCGVEIILGCTDEAAANYNPDATDDDGSCIVCGEDESYVTIEVGGGSFTGEVSWQLLDSEGAVALSGGAPYEAGQCIANDCYTFVMTDSFGDGWNGNTYQIYDGAGELLHEGTLDAGSGPETDFTPIGGSSEDLGCLYPGCTDEEAFNYNPNATVDDETCVYPPENDDCADATPVTCDETYEGSTELATAGLEADGAFDCNTDITAGTWYVFNGTDEQVTVSTCNSTTNTELTIFTIADCGDVETWECLYNNDNGCGTQSEITFPTQAGVDYYIHVGNTAFTANAGEYTLEITCAEACEPVPSNVACESPIFLLDSLEIAGTTHCAPPSTAVTPFCAPAGPAVYGVWYEFTATEPTYYIDVQNTGGAGNIGAAIYGAPAGDPDPCATAIGDGALLCGYATDNVVGPLPFDMVPGDTYFVFVFSSGNENTTDFTINVWAQVMGCTDPAAENFCPECNTDDGSCIPVEGEVPANDLCEDAIAIACGETVEGSLLGATNTAAPLGCITTGEGVWYMVEGDDMLFTASLCGSAADTRVSVYSGECGALTCLGSNAADETPQDDEECGFEFQDDATLDWIGATGETYYLYVESENAATTFDLTLECEEVIIGCTDPIASNYNPDANVEDNGTCDYTFVDVCDDTYTYCYENNSGGTIITYVADNESDVLVITFNAGSVENSWDEIFITDGQGTVLNEDEPYGNAGDLTGLTYQSTGNTITIEVQSDGVFSCASGDISPELDYTFTCIPSGCTEPVACNYDPIAEIDNGTCDFSSCLGCTYEDATNYDETAVIDDGSCDFGPCQSTCPEDLDFNGVVGVGDLLTFLGVFGETCPTVVDEN